MASVTGRSSPSPRPSFADISLLPPAPDGHVRFSREAYHRMFDTGVLDSQKRYERIDGEIVITPPIGPDQGGLISRSTRHFVNHLPNTIDCRVQQAKSQATIAPLAAPDCRLDLGWLFR